MKDCIERKTAWSVSGKETKVHLQVQNRVFIISSKVNFCRCPMAKLSGNYAKTSWECWKLCQKNMPSHRKLGILQKIIIADLVIIYWSDIRKHLRVNPGTTSNNLGTSVTGPDSNSTSFHGNLKKIKNTHKVCCWRKLMG